MKCFVYLLFIFYLNTCLPMNNTKPFRKEVMKVIDEYSETLKKEGFLRVWHGLDCAGADKIYDGKIHEISLCYFVDLNLKYKEARQLFYQKADELIEKINSNEKIGKYFYHFPISYEDLDFTLVFDYESTGRLKKDDVDQIRMQSNEIFYSIANVDEATNKLVATQTYPGMGMLNHSNPKAFRSFFRDLPEPQDAEFSEEIMHKPLWSPPR